MSSYVVGTGSIDYLVTAVLRYAPSFPGVAERDPTEIGRTLLRENIETFAERYLTDEEGSGDVLRAQNAEERAEYDAMLAGYSFHEAAEIDAKSAIRVARNWQYQRTREDWDDFPGSWRLVDAVVAGAISDLPSDAFTDPDGPRSEENIAGLYPA